MLMPQQSSEPIAPITPSPNYDFIYKEPPKPKRKILKLPSMSGPVRLLVGAGVVLIVVIIFGIIASRGGSDGQKYIELMSRSQEIVRVSNAVKPLTKNTDTLSLIATAEAALSSEQSSLSNYLSSAGEEVDEKKLTLYLDKTSDDKIETAGQNNNLESTYAQYLKGQLNSYLGQLQSAFKTADQEAKPILESAINSTKALLSSPQLSAAQ